MPLCIGSVRKQTDNFSLVSISPFVRAVEETFRIAYESDEDWTLALDADVILDEDGLQRIERFGYAKAKHSELTARCDFRVRDKFRGNVYAGCHLYANCWAYQFFSHFKGMAYNTQDKRPESGGIASVCSANGLLSFNCKEDTIGQHDYEQYYCHIYNKYYNRAVRDHKYFDKIYGCLQRKKDSNPDDYDFPVAIAGMEKGKGKTDMRLDHESYLGVSSVLSGIGVTEKEAVSGG